MGETLPTAGKLVSSKLKAVFKSKMYELMSDLGRTITLHMPPSVADCPNCLWDHRKKKSRNTYDSTNTNTNPGPLHKPFLDGQVCPVCNGRGVLNTPQSASYTALMSSKFKEDELTVVGTSHEGVIKTTTHIDSFQDITRAKQMSIDNYNYTPIGRPLKTGLQERIMVKMFWKMVQ
jgi:hypothetical protein